MHRSGCVKMAYGELPDWDEQPDGVRRGPEKRPPAPENCHHGDLMGKAGRAARHGALKAIFGWSEGRPASGPLSARQHGRG